MDFSTTVEAERKDIMEQIIQVKQQIEESKSNVATLESIAQETEQLILRYTRESEKLEGQIQQLEERIKSAKLEWEDIQIKLDDENNEYNQNCQNLIQAREQLKSHNESMAILNLELAELENRIVYLIAPEYDKANLPEELHGRLISTIEFEGVVIEEPKKGVFNYNFDEVADYCEQIGYIGLKESREAYKFALLVIQYRWSTDCEVHILSDDNRIHQLVDWLMS